MSVDKVLEMMEKNGVAFVDLRFTDTIGKAQHITIPADKIDADIFEEGKMFDGSSIAGWKGINESDMLLMPDSDTAVMDPFFDDPTLIITCDVLEPSTMQGYDRCPRSIAKRAETYLQSTGIADTAFFGPEPEFFIFDGVRWETSMQNCSYNIKSEEGCWSSNTDYEYGNTGHRPGVKGGYFPVPPVDSLQNIRSAMCARMTEMGLDVEVHHHEVGTGGQCEIGSKFNTLVQKADENQILKYCVQNVAHGFGKTATFMPKPLVGDNGSGMHCHQSLAKDGKNIFMGDKYGGLSDLALHYIAGVFKHARALNAFTNPSTNSYKRLIPGFEAPVSLAYSARNRSASCRIPWVSNPKARRIELRFPDPCCNPYLGFAAMMLAGLDGIMNKLDPGEPLDKNLYDLPPEEAQNIPQVAGSLKEALISLEKDYTFLTAGGVFSENMIAAYTELKMEEVTRYDTATHPVEFDMYYSL